MPLETEYVGMTEAPAESYLGKTRFKVTCRCLRCDHVYKKIVKNLTDANPPCPKKKCREAIAAEEKVKMERNMRAMIEAERGPGHVGANVSVRAIDATADIVMQDYGLTNLKDNIRSGDSMAPPLPPKMQSAADNFFKGSVSTPETNDRRKKQMQLIQHRALAGAYRNMAINPGLVVPGQRGSQTLRKIGEEKLR